MNFKKHFKNSLISSSMLTSVVSIDQYLPSEIETSDLLKENLPYPQAFDKLQVFYPYQYELSHLDSYCIIQTVSGEGTLFFDEQTYILSVQTIAFLDCRKKHKLEIKHSPWEYNVIFANGSPFSFFHRNFVDQYICLHTFPVYSNIPKLMESILKERGIGTIPELNRSNLLFQLLIELSIEKDKKTTTLPNIPEYLLSMKHSLDTLYHQSFSLDHFEQELHVSKYRLCREFSFYFHDSPIQYLNQVRIAMAKNLLLTTDIRINEIGHQVGIENTNHFIRLFKKQTGVTPLLFRKQPPAI